MGLQVPRDGRGLLHYASSELHQTIRVLGQARPFLPIPPRIERDPAFESEVSANVTSTLLVLLP